MEDDKKTAHILLLSGGAFRGAVQVPVIRELMNTFKYKSVHGVSIGSINGVMASMGKMDKLMDFWLGIDGLSPYLTFRWFYMICWVLGLVPLYEWLTGRSVLGGVYSMKGLHDKLVEEVDLRSLRVPFTAGVVSMGTGKYYTIDSRTVGTSERMAKACLVSSCMAPLMSPPRMQLEEDTDEEELGFDGGLRNIFPVPTAEIARLRGEGYRIAIHAVGCTPMARILRKGVKDVNDMLEIMVRGLEILESEIYENDLLQLRKAIGSDGILRVWTPGEYPGDSLDASKDMIRKRLEIGERTIKGTPDTYSGLG